MVDEAVVVLRVALALTFSVSAVAKLAQWRAMSETAAALGVHRRIAPVARTLPAVEIGVAALLVPATTARAGGAAAAALLGSFTALLLVNLVRGRRPSCNCFGRRSPRPISWLSVLRNVALLAGASVIVAAGGAPVPALVENREGGGLALGAAVAIVAVAFGVQGWVLVGVLRQHGRLLLRVDALEAGVPADIDSDPVDATGLPVGTVAPEFAVGGMHGETMTLGALRAAGKPVLLVLSDPGCGPCNALAPTVADWQRRHADRLRVVVIGSGEVDANRAKAAEHGLVDVYVQEGTTVGERFGYQGTPGAVLVDVAGRIAAPLASGGPAIESLVDRVVGNVPVEFGRRPDLHDGHHHGSVHQPVGLPVGTDAPSFRLPTVNGGEASLEEFRGRPAVLLFWNPRCGFCESLLSEVLEWEAARGPAAPDLLVVSTGDETANAGEGFTSTVFLDATSSAMSAYRANGTPMAVLVDADGRIASTTGIGAAGVRDLLYSATKELA